MPTVLHMWRKAPTLARLFTRAAVSTLAALSAGTALAQALTPEHNGLAAGCQKYATQVYSVSHFGEPSITQEFNSTYMSFKADNVAIACEYLTNAQTGRKLFNSISADGVPRARLVLGDPASTTAVTRQFFDYYSVQGLGADQIEPLAREWLASLQVRHFQAQ